MSRTAVLAIALLCLMAVPAFGGAQGNNNNNKAPSKDDIAKTKPKEENGHIICPIVNATGAVTGSSNCTEKGIPKGQAFCHATQGCIDKKEDPREGPKDTWTRLNRLGSNDTYGTCKLPAGKKDANGKFMTENKECAVACAGKKCPPSAGNIYTCGNLTSGDYGCVKDSKLAASLIKLPVIGKCNKTDKNVENPVRPDVCGKCGGRGSSCKLASGAYDCDTPGCVVGDNANATDAFVPAGADGSDAKILEAITTAGIAPNAVAITSRTDAVGNKLRRSRRMNQVDPTAQNDQSVILTFYDEDAYNQFLAAVASGQITNIYGVRALSEVAPTSFAATTTSPSGGTPGTNTGAGSAVAPSVLAALLLALAALLL